MIIIRLIIKIVTFLALIFILFLVAWQVDQKFHLFTAEKLEPFNGFKTVLDEFPQDQKSCEQQQGQWKKLGLGIQEECNLLTADVNQACADSEECEGYCLAQLSEPELLKAQQNKIVTTNGYCSEWLKVVGCQVFVQNSVAYYVCID